MISLFTRLAAVAIAAATAAVLVPASPASAASTEFPQYRFIQAKHYATGRPYGAPRWIVVHTTEGAESAGAALGEANYATRRRDSVSAHFFVDNAGAVQAVRTSDRAYTAYSRANNFGVNIELQGRASQSAGQWADAYSDGVVRQGATVAGLVSRRYGIPLRTLSDAELRAGKAGVITHGQVTRVFRVGSHTDPGPNFPMGKFLALAGGSAPVPASPPAAAPRAVPGNPCVVGAGPTVRYGSRGAAVRAVQACLNARGYSAGPVDGAFGARTRAAVLRFQRAAQLRRDGVVGNRTRAALRW